MNLIINKKVADKMTLNFITYRKEFDIKILYIMELVKDAECMNDLIDAEKQKIKFLINQAIKFQFCYGCESDDNSYHFICNKTLDHIFIITKLRVLEKALLTLLPDVDDFVIDTLKDDTIRFKLSFMRRLEELRHFFIVNENIITDKKLPLTLNTVYKIQSEFMINIIDNIDFDTLECLSCQDSKLCYGRNTDRRGGSCISPNHLQESRIFSNILATIRERIPNIEDADPPRSI